jgi:hypothetical protein
MKQSLIKKVNGDSANQETARILEKPKIHTRTHNSPPSIPTASDMNPIFGLPPYCFKICIRTRL